MAVGESHHAGWPASAYPLQKTRHTDCISEHDLGRVGGCFVMIRFDL